MKNLPSYFWNLIKEIRYPNFKVRAGIIFVGIFFVFLTSWFFLPPKGFISWKEALRFICTTPLILVAPTLSGSEKINCLTDEEINRQLRPLSDMIDVIEKLEDHYGEHVFDFSLHDPFLSYFDGDVRKFIPFIKNPKTEGWFDKYEGEIISQLRDVHKHYKSLYSTAHKNQHASDDLEDDLVSRFLFHEESIAWVGDIEESIDKLMKLSKAWGYELNDPRTEKRRKSRRQCETALFLHQLEIISETVENLVELMKGSEKIRSSCACAHEWSPSLSIPRVRGVSWIWGGVWPKEKQNSKFFKSLFGDFAVLEYAVGLCGSNAWLFCPIATTSESVRLADRIRWMNEYDIREWLYYLRPKYDQTATDQVWRDISRYFTLFEMEELEELRQELLEFSADLKEIVGWDKFPSRVLEYNRDLASSHLTARHSPNFSNCHSYP